MKFHTSLKEVNALTEPKACTSGMEECFFGTVNVGERGQVVIPAEARKKLDIHTGDKLIIMSHPTDHGFMLFKIGAMREFLDYLTTGLSMAEAGGNDSETKDEQ
jgi:AbrB family looped-hinge helix DNA binding protein